MLLIKNGRLVDPKSGTDRKMDILIHGGKVKRLAENIEEENHFEIINASGMVVSPGFIDVHVHFRDPGQTVKEDMVTGSRSAARGGFTTVVAMANTDPVVDNKEILSKVIEKARGQKIEILQVATVTKGMEGKEINNLKSLKEAGAAGFSDDGKPIMDASILKAAMELSKELDLPISLHEEDPSLIKMNGINKWAPRIAEDTMVARDVAMAINIGSKLNIQHISSGNAVENIRWGKLMGANIFAEVTPHHFSLTEEAVGSHGSLSKMNPPLRTAWDREEIIEGLKDNTIDIIATDHAPHTLEEKNLSLEEAPSGIIGLETALPLAITNLVDQGHLNMLDMLEKITINPAKLYNLDRGYISQGSRADITIFDPEEESIIGNFLSKSSNSPFKGQNLKGKIKYTISGGEFAYKD